MARTQAGSDQVKGVDLSGTTDDVTGTLTVQNGGTGNNTNTLGSVLVGNGTGALTGVAPSTSTNVLTSNGSAWTSAPIPTLNQNTSGNAATATALATARTINGVSFNGSANIVVVPRVGTTTSSATPTIDASLYEQYNITALAAAITSLTVTNGADGMKLVVRIKDNGTAHALAFGSGCRAIGVTLPTTTVVSKTLYLGMIYNSADSVWDVVALAQQA